MRTCTYVFADIQSLSRIDCDCEGFRSVVGAFRDAAFAENDEEDFTLRLA